MAARKPDVPGVPGMRLEAPRYIDRTATRTPAAFSPEQLRELADIMSTSAEMSAAVPAAPTVPVVRARADTPTGLRSLLPPAARGWSPVGIAMAVVTLVTGLGGLAGIGQVVVSTAKELKGAGLATQAEMADVSKRIDAIDRRLDQWQDAADNRDARIGAAERKLEVAGEFDCTINGGQSPYVAGPCPEPGEWNRTNTNVRALTGYRADRAWK